MIVTLNQEQAIKLAELLAERAEDGREPTLALGHPEGWPGAFRSVTLSDGGRASVFVLNAYGEIVPTPAQLQRARKYGEQIGTNAGTWAAEATTPQTTIRAILKAQEEGDGWTLDCLLPPTPTLSDDSETPVGLASDILDLDGDYINDNAVDALCEAWEAGVEETYIKQCIATVSNYLTLDGE